MSLKSLVLSNQPVIRTSRAQTLRHELLAKGQNCHFCGVHDTASLDIVFADDEYRLEKSQVALACPVCSAVLQGGVFNGAEAGVMINVPDNSEGRPLFTQNELIGLWHALQQCTKIEPLGLKGVANGIRSTIVGFQDGLISLLPDVGDEISMLSNPSVWVGVFDDARFDYSSRCDLFRNVLLWPSESVFEGLVRQYIEQGSYTFNSASFDALYKRFLTTKATKH